MGRWTLRSGALFALASLAVLAAPLVLEPSGERMLARMLVYGLFALSVNFLLGVAGIASLGHGLFFGAGGYGVALLWLHHDIPPLLMLAAAPVLGALVAALTGFVTFRAEGLYFALITVGLSQAAYVLIVQWYSVTQGEDGVYGIELPARFLVLQNRFHLVAVVVILVVLLLRVVVASPFGTTLQAVRQNRERVSYLGVNPRRYEYACWVASGAVASLAGALLVVFNQTAFPNVFHWSFSATPLLMSIIGGTSYFFGPVAGAVFAVYIQDGVAAWEDRTNLVYGLAVLAVALAGQDGVLGFARSARDQMMRFVPARAGERE